MAVGSFIIIGEVVFSALWAVSILFAFSGSDTIELIGKEDTVSLDEFSLRSWPVRCCLLTTLTLNFSKSLTLI